MKQLIEDATTENFQHLMNSWLNIPGSISSSADYKKLLEIGGASEDFKGFIDVGYQHFTHSLIKSGVSEFEVRLLLAQNFSFGLIIGFKYAMYLHEQRELATLSENVGQDTTDFEIPDDYEFDK